MAGLPWAEPAAVGWAAVIVQSPLNIVARPRTAIWHTGNPRQTMAGQALVVAAVHRGSQQSASDLRLLALMAARSKSSMCMMASSSLAAALVRRDLNEVPPPGMLWLTAL